MKVKFFLILNMILFSGILIECGDDPKTSEPSKIVRNIEKNLDIKLGFLSDKEKELALKSIRSYFFSLKAVDWVKEETVIRKNVSSLSIMIPSYVHEIFLSVQALNNFKYPLYSVERTLSVDRDMEVSLILEKTGS
ncbi:MAG: hypothetical protein HYS98_01440 [Deltaproteobacteria bacterium]|nr:hypothetical protein [Deltaproteobacteria bacterium]